MREPELVRILESEIQYCYLRSSQILANSRIDQSYPTVVSGQMIVRKHENFCWYVFGPIWLMGREIEVLPPLRPCPRLWRAGIDHVGASINTLVIAGSEKASMLRS